MSKLRRFRVWSLVAVAVLCVCAVVYAATLPTAIYQPLKVGNTWTIKYTGTGANYTAVTTLTKATVKSGLTWYEGKTTGAPGGTLDSSYCHTATGLLVSTTQVTTPSPYYLIKTPLKAGCTWTMTTAPGVIKRTITSLTATTTVPAGTFKNCLLITQTYPKMPGFTVKYWYAPNKGMVRCENWMGTVKTETAELTKCTLK